MNPTYQLSQDVLLQQKQKLVAVDPKTRDCLNKIETVAAYDCPVLLLGELGTGKTTLSVILHSFSKRRVFPFQTIDCTTLPDNLAESELFGHEQGAFTGAVKAKAGLFETCNGGTIFLDEIGELSRTNQSKLLRVILEQKARRVGGLDEYTTNVRVVAATNKNLEQMVSNGEFREDLFYRLNSVIIQVPALRQRKLDIVPLAEYFLRQIENGASYIPLKRRSALALETHDWPGNLHELKNYIERSVIFSKEKDLQILLHEDGEHLEPQAKLEYLLHYLLTVCNNQPVLKILERECIIQALHLCDNNKTHAAKLLSCSVRSLYDKIVDYGINIPDKETKTLD